MSKSYFEGWLDLEVQLLTEDFEYGQLQIPVHELKEDIISALYKAYKYGKAERECAD